MSDEQIMVSFQRVFSQWAADESVPDALRDDLRRFGSWFVPIRAALSRQQAQPTREERWRG